MRSPRAFSWKSGARAAYPRWKSVVGIELSLAVLIIGAVAASLIGAAQTVIGKVRVVDTLSVMHVGKVAVVEHYAVTGRPLATDMFGEERRADSSAPEYERHLSAAAAFAAVASASGQKGTRFGWIEDTSAYYSRAGVVDGAILGIGRVAGFRGAYRMALNPVDLEGGGPVLLWACGSAPLPAGYTAVGTRIADRVNPQLMIHPCRSARPW